MIARIQRSNRSIAESTGKPNHHLAHAPWQIPAAREWNCVDERWTGAPRILMAAGHGYGNVGDEAQCGACIDRWRRLVPEARITLLTPNPAFTAALHGELCEWAPRVAWFRSNTIGPYFEDNDQFDRFYQVLKFRILSSAHLLRRRIPLLLSNAREARVLQVIQDHDIVHISGGGFLTGRTRSRLWENALLMKVCSILGVPYFLTGQTIGVFEHPKDKTIAEMGLKGSMYIGLRDPQLSKKALNEIGIYGNHVESVCDDALLCPRAPSSAVIHHLQLAGVNTDEPWAAVNFHDWGQKPGDREKIAKRFAEYCDYLKIKHRLQVVFVAMLPSDSIAEAQVASFMRSDSIIAPYTPDFRLVRGIIGDSYLCLTMKHHPIVFAQGEGVPVLSVALDPYYEHKNHGALENTDHGLYHIAADQFESSNAFQLVDKAIRNRKEISVEQKTWVEQMRTKELLAYQRAIQALEETTQNA